MKQILLISCVYFSLISKSIANKRLKRLLHGRPTTSNDFYDTHYTVSLQDTHGCVSDQFDHKLLDCLTQHRCGGSLIKEDFVLTACHCLVYDEYYWIRLPDVHEIEPDRIISFIDSPYRIHNRPWMKGDPLVFRSEAIVKHPLLNTMTIWAGGVEVSLLKQRRHASAFFPHHLCAPRQEVFHPEQWKDKIYEMDIGLVKTCYPFNLNHDLRLAPVNPYEEIERHLNRILDHSYTCLTVGWGDVWKDDKNPDRGEELPDLLQHAFREIVDESRVMENIPEALLREDTSALRWELGRHKLVMALLDLRIKTEHWFVGCRFYCGEENFRLKHHCVFCSSHHGVVVNSLAHGDSGSPIICDGFVTGVNAWNEYKPSINMSGAMHVAVACIRDLITPNHLAYLRSKRDETFHWVDGMPVTNPPNP